MATLRAVENKQPAAAARGGSGAPAAAGVPSVVDALAKLTVSTATGPGVPPTFQYVPESLEQVGMHPGLAFSTSLVAGCLSFVRLPLCATCAARHASSFVAASQQARQRVGCSSSG